MNIHKKAQNLAGEASSGFRDTRRESAPQCCNQGVTINDDDDVDCFDDDDVDVDVDVDVDDDVDVDVKHDIKVLFTALYRER